MTSGSAIRAALVLLPALGLQTLQADARAARLFHKEDVVVRESLLLSQSEVDKVKSKYLNRSLDDDMLEDIRRDLTLVLVNKGYIASGARWAQPMRPGGPFVIEVVEGRLTGIEVREVRVDDQGRDVAVGDRSSLAGYVCDRLGLLSGGLLAAHPEGSRIEVKVCGRATPLDEGPLNVKAVQRRVAELLRDPAIARLNVDIRPGEAPGEAWLDAKVVARRPWDLSASVANDEPPNVGATHGQINGAVRNLFGRNETISWSYGRTQGANIAGARIEIPVTAYDTRVAFNWGYNGAGVVSADFQGLGVRSVDEIAGVAILQPLMQTESQALTGSLLADYTISEQWLLGAPFSFEPGYVNGQARSAAVRASLEWTFHGETPAQTAAEARWQTFTLRATVSHGVDAPHVTDLPMAPNAKFFSLLAQAQYASQFADATQIYGRLVGQVSSQALYSFEQVAIGGPSTVRGYVQNAILRDDALLGSLELRHTVAYVTIPGVSAGDRDGAVALCPFVDAGEGWSYGPTTPPSALASVGLGLTWEPREGLTARIDYGYGLVRTPATSGLFQPLSFNVSAQF